jgi:disulfide bond formation protein DsbB
MSYALYAQHVLHLEACPLCIFQRIAMIAVGAVFAIAALHAPRGASARVYAGLGALAALIGAGISSWHVHLQSLPPDAVPACGPGFDYIFSGTFPLRDALAMVFTGSGECAEVNWRFAGLSMPAWVLVFFALLGAFAVVANTRKLDR